MASLKTLAFTRHVEQPRKTSPWSIANGKVGRSPKCHAWPIFLADEIQTPSTQRNSVCRTARMQKNAAPFVHAPAWGCRDRAAMNIAIESKAPGAQAPFAGLSSAEAARRRAQFGPNAV